VEDFTAESNWENCTDDADQPIMRLTCVLRCSTIKWQHSCPPVLSAPVTCTFDVAGDAGPFIGRLLLAPCACCAGAFRPQ